jgi:hypothetical protein
LFTFNGDYPGLLFLGNHTVQCHREQAIGKAGAVHFHVIRQLEGTFECSPGDTLMQPGTLTVILRRQITANAQLIPGP